MVIRKYNIRNDQFKYLTKVLKGNEAEHVRAALDIYIDIKKREEMNVSSSASSFLKGGITTDGKSNTTPNPAEPIASPSA